MTEAIQPDERKKRFYGVMFLLGFAASVVVLIQLLQTMGNMPALRVALRLVVLLFFAAKTTDYFQHYRMHSRTGP